MSTNNTTITQPMMRRRFFRIDFLEIPFTDNKLSKRTGEPEVAKLLKLPSLFRRGAEALRGGVVVQKNLILILLPPRQPKRLPPLLNKEGSSLLTPPPGSGK